MNKLIKEPIREAIFLALKPFRGNDRPCTLVASNGRSASTMLTNAIADSLLLSHRFPSRTLVRRFARKPTRHHLAPGTVVKTHADFAPEFDSASCKSVYIFGDPRDSVASVHHALSTRGEAWVRRHLRNLDSGDKVADLLNRDALRQYENMKSWTQGDNGALKIRYESLWENVEEIRDYLCMPDLELPKRVARQSKYEALPIDTQGMIESSYNDAIRLYESLSDVWVSRDS